MIEGYSLPFLFIINVHVKEKDWPSKCEVNLKQMHAINSVLVVNLFTCKNKKLFQN